VAATFWGVRWISDSFSSVPRPHFIADRGPTFISVEHPLFLVEVSTDIRGNDPSHLFPLVIGTLGEEAGRIGDMDLTDRVETPG
jgi:hypothetical protein